MEQDLPEIKMLKLKLELTQDIKKIIERNIAAFNVKAKGLFNKLCSFETSESAKRAGGKVKLELSIDEWKEICVFFNIAVEDDLVNSTYSDNYSIEYAKEAKIKEKILQKL